MLRPTWILFALFSTACGGPPEQAQKVADALTGDDKGTASANPQCKLFTRAEIATYIGEPVSAGENAAMGAGCQWLAADGTGDVIVTVVPARYHEEPTESKGYKTLPEVGKEGFVSSYFDGWAAGAIVGENAVRVSVAGSKATAETAIALLRDSMKRHSP